MTTHSEYTDLTARINNVGEALNLPVGGYPGNVLAYDEILQGQYEEMVRSGLRLLHVANFYRLSIIKRAERRGCPAKTP